MWWKDSFVCFLAFPALSCAIAGFSLSKHLHSWKEAALSCVTEGYGSTTAEVSDEALEFLRGKGWPEVWVEGSNWDMRYRAHLESSIFYRNDRRDKNECCQTSKLSHSCDHEICKAQRRVLCIDDFQAPL